MANMIGKREHSRTDKLLPVRCLEKSLLLLLLFFYYEVTGEITRERLTHLAT